jgi:Ca2+-binding RTX toxin-like protein
MTTLNTPLAVNVITNDTDPNGNPLQISSFDTISTQGGSITLNDNGTVDDLSDDLLVYTPASDLLGFDSFSYTIDNGIGGTATATVNLAVFSQLGTFGNDTLTGSSVGDFIRGGAGDDLVDGTEGNDKLLGNWGNDILVGGEGNDLLAGGFGNDLLVGGGGSDRFLLVSNLETDTIADFESGVDALALFGSLTFGQLDITQSNDDTLISVTGTGEVLATLTGVQANLLTAADFINI